MDVLFAVVPFAEVARPSIGVSLLQAAVNRLGFSSRIHYFNINFAEQIGLDLYLRLANAFPPDTLIGEWFFADLVFGDQIPDEHTYLAKVLTQYPYIPEILKARQFRQRFIDRCVQEIQHHNPRVVGFTTTFHQTCACLAIAQRLKDAVNPPVIVFGGANCEGEMGLQMIRSFPWVDYVCTQEGDLAFPAFLEQLLNQNNPHPPPGILRRGESKAVTQPELVRNLDQLPIPTYEDYFAQLADSNLAGQIRPSAAIETSRGCWWGAKNHCTFCGLNGATMQYRSKSPERAFAELVYLKETYGLKQIESVDNILDLKYIKTLFPQLIEADLGIELFYETKANLKWHQLSILAQAGVRTIQPGIESLSDVVLRLMNKGCTSAQNIQLLRWADELGITVAWNIISGFPGEPHAEYDAMAELIPLLVHLQPPTGCSPFRLDRFSPYHSQPEQYGLRNIRPSYSYYYIFPYGGRELGRLAYYFDFDYADGQNPDTYIGSLTRAVQHWWNVYRIAPEERPRLDLHHINDTLIIQDTRPCAVAATHRLEGLIAEIFLFCDTAQTRSTITHYLPPTTTEPEIEAALQYLQDAKLLVALYGHFLSLAVFRDRALQQGDNRFDGYIQLEEATSR
jgi:ribosomal peptide maturation radical SAM protein 1